MNAKPRSKGVIILILGAMTALSPFSIDMYLPAFQDIAKEFGTTVAQISLSLSSYFVGLSFGQLFYGPLLDRFGRKRPVYAGLLIYVAASMACLISTTGESLVAWRFIQALGGCAAGVGSMAMVRDLFTTRESAKVFSLLVLILGASPLLAPTIGGYLATAFGWQSIFVVLAAMALLLLLAIHFFLDESHISDHSVKLRFLPIFKNFAEILRDPRFYTYVFSGAVSFSGLFVYLAGSPIIFLNHFAVSREVYGWIFAIIATGFISVSQLNVLLLRRFENEDLLLTGIIGQVLMATIFLIGSHLGWFGLYGTVLMFFCYMSCFGITNSNSTALALAPFGARAGSASALMGFLQMGLGAVISSLVGIFDIHEVVWIVTIMTIASISALGILILGKSQIAKMTISGRIS